MCDNQTKDNCSDKCYVCELDFGYIRSKLNLFNLCDDISICISAKTTCDAFLFDTSCVFMNNIFRIVCVCMLFGTSWVSFRKIIAFVHLYEKYKKIGYIIIGFIFLVTFLTPVVVIYITHVVYFQFIILSIMMHLSIICFLPNYDDETTHSIENDYYSVNTLPSTGD